MNSVEELCRLIGSCIAWEEDEAPRRIRPDTPLLTLGLLDSMAIVRIVASLESATGVPFPESRIVASNFTSPHALWGAVSDAVAEAVSAGDSHGAVR
ncbi:phosphopantetheine-binding protein [Streptomyces palmae]|uniref:Carrier domain-containing protein n=1 Tax=Streptomyces palmae TaxID=1701085 RepID=A0A4Z0GK76_9ACTN|nr:phosphopantetheine-binding protein [Streptomyces palmae]TGA95911.1 hypothetical protein E4099_24590 [Streptomyces palmae]